MPRAAAAGGRCRSRKLTLLGALFLAATGCGSSGSTERPPSATPSPASGWTLAWSDEFEGPSGALVDATKWVFEQGGGGWGNRELETYTDRTHNASLDGQGALAIQALRETFTGTAPYGSTPRRASRPRGSSSRPTDASRPASRSRGARACGPRSGCWGPISERVVGRAAARSTSWRTSAARPRPCTERFTARGTRAAAESAPRSPLPGGARFADDLHLFAIEWEPAAIRWYVDGTPYETRTPADVPAGQRWAFDHPFFVLLNVAVGGNWPGNPDATTVFPQTMLVDYVRVYRRNP